MNWTCKLLAVTLATVASHSLDVHAQSTLDSQLNKAPEQMKLFSMESEGACRSGSGHYSGSEDPYAEAEAYQVYSALIPELSPNPETKTWFIRIDTSAIFTVENAKTIKIGGSLDDQARKLWKQTRGADTALDDYYKVNRKIWRLQRKFTLPNPYKLVTPDEIKAMFPPNFREGRFGELWLALSAVGFNANKTLAVVYMSHVCTTDDGCAGGDAYVLQKQNGKWKVSSKTGCWIS